MLYNVWPEILPRLRKKAGLTQEEAAAAAGGASATTWYRWEKGDNVPHRSQFDLIAKVLGMSPNELGLEYAQALRLHYVVARSPEAFASLPKARLLPTPEELERQWEMEHEYDPDDPLSLLEQLVDVTPPEGRPGLKFLGEGIKRLMERDAEVSANTAKLVETVSRVTGIQLDDELTSWISAHSK